MIAFLFLLFSLVQTAKSWHATSERSCWLGRNCTGRRLLTSGPSAHLPWGAANLRCRLCLSSEPSYPCAAQPTAALKHLQHVSTSWGSQQCNKRANTPQRFQQKVMTSIKLIAPEKMSIDQRAHAGWQVHSGKLPFHTHFPIALQVRQPAEPLSWSELRPLRLHLPPPGIM